MACQSKKIPMEVACVVTSNPYAEGVGKALRLRIPQKDIIAGGDFLEELQKREVTVVTQNGWLPKTPEKVIDVFPGKIFNQHPGPVPEFGGAGMYGRRVPAAVLLFTRMTKREPWTQVVVQRVHYDWDQGVVVGSKRVPILPSDTVEDLQKRILPVEHRLQIELLKQVAEGKVIEIAARESLVKPDQEETLKLAKRMARLLYPKG